MQKSVADKQSEMESKPVLYHRNGTVKFPVTYTQLLRETERLRAEIERLQALAKSTAHFLYWSGWLDAGEIDEVKIVLRNGAEIQCGTRTFDHLREALDEACPDWRTWNEIYSTL